jgi:predicted nucleic acid-binding protein
VPTFAKRLGDNLVLAAAESAGASYIVSGDRELLDLGGYAGNPIVAARRFLELVAEGNGDG